MKKRALGKGLGALIPERVLEEGRGIIDIRIDDIRTSERQPRKDFPEEKMRELVASIEEKGVIQPVIIRRSESGFDLIAGERRLRAARMLGFESIPSVVRDASDEDAYEISLIENIQRQDLNPIEEANGYKQLMDAYDLKQDDVARKVGKDRATVANSLRLLKLPGEIQKSLERGVLSVGHAKAILACKERSKMMELYRAILKKGLSVRETERLASKTESKKKTRSETQEEPHVRACADELQRKLRTKVKIQMHGTKRGRIEIHFYSINDLDRIINDIM